MSSYIESRVFLGVKISDNDIEKLSYGLPEGIEIQSSGDDVYDNMSSFIGITLSVVDLEENPDNEINLTTLSQSNAEQYFKVQKKIQDFFEKRGLDTDIKLRTYLFIYRY